jgi:hypothetical protein
MPCSIALRQLVSRRLLPLLQLLDLAGACRRCLVRLCKVRMGGLQLFVKFTTLAN